MKTSTCKSCGKPIHWIRTRSGRSMPCDTRPVSYRIKPGGSTKLVTPAGDVISCETVDNPAEAQGWGLYATLEHLQRAGLVQEGGKEMIALNILLGVVATVLLIGVLGEKDNQRHKSITLAFVSVIALIICMNTIF